MRSRYALWSDNGILTPKDRQMGGPVIAAALVGCVVCGISVAGVLSQIVPDGRPASAVGVAAAGQPAPTPPLQSSDARSSEMRSVAVNANTRPTVQGATQEPPEVKSEPAEAPRANIAEGNADLGKNTAHAPGTADQKSRSMRRYARSGADVQVYVTPDGREPSVRRLTRGDGYAAFEPWDRNERSSRRVHPSSGRFNWFTMRF